MKISRILFSALSLSLLVSACGTVGSAYIPPADARGISPDASTKRAPTVRAPIFALNGDPGSWSNIWTAELGAGQPVR